MILMILKKSNNSLIYKDAIITRNQINNNVRKIVYYRQ